MNPWLATALAGSRRREMRGEAAPRQTGRPYARTRPARGEFRRWRMRRQVGYTLVEVGLHLLATAGPASARPTSSLPPRT
jgi:hypothetical protein